MTMRKGFSIILAFLYLACTEAFVSSQRRWRSARSRPRQASSAHDHENLDEMRQLLEASWNADIMGSVPSTPDAAAEAAAVSLQGAMNKGQSLFYVDLLLPSYDITQGENMYDEVMAVEFCIALTVALEDQSVIYVRDDNRLNSINRILDARERDRMDEQIIDVEEEETGDGENDSSDKTKSSSLEFFDDFGDLGGDSANRYEAEPLSTEDVDSFRKKLMASWDSPDAKTETPSCSETERNKTAKMAPRRSNRMYRMASMLGDANISRGPDMVDKVVASLKENAMPVEKEDTLIILSAVSPEELVAVRSLVGSFKSNKNIILVNCKLDPPPRELMGAETVYSILPLIARPTTSDQNIFRKDEPEPQKKQPKVVVMRKFPTDWEVYIDSNDSGFELADTLPVSQAKKFPPMEWIAGCVKRHLESKLEGS